MQKITLISILTLGVAFSVPLNAQKANFRMYDVRSGKITYTVRGGNQALKINAKKRRIFDQYGYRELVEEARVQTMNILGHAQKTKTHTLDLRIGTVVTHADFGQKTLTKIPAVGLDMIVQNGSQNLTRTGEEMLRKMGGRKMGTERVAGYTCDVWKMPIVTQCLYHGVPLKIVSNVMGAKQTEIATEASFDVAVHDTSFKLPKFRHQSLPPQASGMLDGATNAPDTDKADLGALFQQAIQHSRNKPTQDMQQLKATLGAAMLPQMQQRIAIQSRALKITRPCIAHAKTLKEANRCVDQATSITKEQGEHFDHWDAAKRQTTLREIDAALDQMDCAQRAKTMQQMQQCNGD